MLQILASASPVGLHVDMVFVLPVFLSGGGRRPLGTACLALQIVRKRHEPMVVKCFQHSCTDSCNLRSLLQVK